MGDLSKLSLKTSYRSDQDNLIKDFYNPCMYNSTLYQRAVGYFTSYSLAYAASGIAHLVSVFGKIQLIASPCLTDEDIEAIRLGYSSRNDIIIIAVKRTFVEIKDLLVHDRLKALSWLIASGNMEVKLAIKCNNEGMINKGIYHEKVGIFKDNKNNQVAFIGSANETSSGLLGNFESIDVYCSWDDPQNRVSDKMRIFDRLWDNCTKGLSVIDFTSVTSDILTPYYPGNSTNFSTDIFNGNNAYKVNMKKEPDFPTWLELRDYQEEAIKNWFNNNGRGCLKMATGSGKTITALSIIVHLLQKVRLKAVIILCPLKHLVNQWDREAEKFNLKPLVIHTSKKIWQDELNYRLSTLGSGSKLLMIIITNASFCQEYFQKKIRYFPFEKTLLIADEVHNTGAEKIHKKLPEEIKWRLGLSATPERWFDEEGTVKIFEYFGDVLKPEFTLKNAIDSGALVPYCYYPLLIELTDEELDEYFSLSKQIAQIILTQGLDENNQYLTHLLLKRARLTAGAANKLNCLKDLMQDKNDTAHWLFYCGDSKAGYPSSETEIRQIEAVCKILGLELNMKIDKFLAETPNVERQQIIKDLDSGVLQGLVAIRCLDEGVDIPATQNAVILASSTNPRQFIQRRGRVLRKAVGKNSANIYDMIVVPPKEVAFTEIERSLLRKELIRFTEFADLAKNNGVAREIILELQKKYELLDI